MPEGTRIAGLTQRSQQLADAVLGRGLNFTTRLHILHSWKALGVDLARPGMDDTRARMARAYAESST